MFYHNHIHIRTLATAALLLSFLFILPASGQGSLDTLYHKPAGVQSRWASFENPGALKGQGGMENKGAKGHAFDMIHPGEVKTLLDVKGSGTIRRFWMTIMQREPQMLRSLRLDMYWDGAFKPAVSVPLGDFFGASVGQLPAFENALFSSPLSRDQQEDAGQSSGDYAEEQPHDYQGKAGGCTHERGELHIAPAHSSFCHQRDNEQQPESCDGAQQGIDER